MIKEIPGFNGYYSISDDGDVYSSARIVIDKNGESPTVPPRILKKRISKRGYYTVNLCINGFFKTKTIHLLLANAFILNPEKKPTVNHKDGDKLNNSLENLEWATFSEQLYHAYKMGLNHRQPKMSALNPHAKRVVQKDFFDNIVKIWDCARDASRAGFNYKSISACVTGRRMNYANYKWAYYG